MEKHEKLPEEHIDSLGQPNPAFNMEVGNIKKAQEAQAKRDKEEKEGIASPKAPKAAVNHHYEDKTVAELKEIAHKKGVHIDSDARKDDIIAALES